MQRLDKTDTEYEHTFSIGISDALNRGIENLQFGLRRKRKIIAIRQILLIGIAVTETLLEQGGIEAVDAYLEKLKSQRKTPKS